MKMINVKAGATPYFLVEREAWEGVKRVAGVVAEDMELVSGVRPEVGSDKSAKGKQVILFATIGRSFLLDSLPPKEYEYFQQIAGKREVFAIRFVEQPWAGVEQALIICGSDKRGTIYGMFTLSEYLGVQPLVYWGNAAPLKRDQIRIEEDIQQVSKEPSVRYRGFFINDEWPCFGSWTFEHFGGFRFEMYEKVFELLLRLKGNYLWPAMWSSCFSMDGPGLESARLADIYGVVMGTSHHEPCMRAGEEWRIVNQQDPTYGEAWNYRKNKEGLLRFWKEGLLRGSEFENIITIGMRGERDTPMPGQEYGLGEQIELLKLIIEEQRDLIRQCIPLDNGEESPELLVVYKEVEEAFYGNSDTAGLKDWDGLEGVTCMLCEDNFGYLRTLPSAELRERKGGWGMYYHLDYHGGPVSHEWVDSRPLSRIWEQMSAAYDYGVRDVWMVNVGDLKFHEVSLSYFMDLAYEMKPWSPNVDNHCTNFLQSWTKRYFPKAEESLRQDMIEVYTGMLKLNGMRQPEALSEETYHPCHYQENQRILDQVQVLWDQNDKVLNKLEREEKDGFYSMIYWPARSVFNVFRIQLYAGKNLHYARQGKWAANSYADLVEECILEDERLAKELAAWKGGIWKGMERESHIGFTSWNEDGCRYPLRLYVTPTRKNQLAVSRADEEWVALKKYGDPEVIQIHDFLNGPAYGIQEVLLEIANLGAGSVDYTIRQEGEGKCPWILAESSQGQVSCQETVRIVCDRSKLSVKREEVRFLIETDDTTIVLEIAGSAPEPRSAPAGTFLEQCNCIVMEATDYCEKRDTSKGEFTALTDHGRSGQGMRVWPVTAAFDLPDEKPEITWRFWLEQEGSYVVELWLTPNGPAEPGQRISYGIRMDQEDIHIMHSVPEGYCSGDNNDRNWIEGVLCNIRKNGGIFHLEAGLHHVTVQALEPGLVVERILIWREDRPLKDSYLGPERSWKN